MKDNRPFCLSIAGYDPTAGAGVLADTKTFEMLGVYGMAIITANTLQTDDCFLNVHWLSVDTISAQMKTLFAKYRFAVVKIGLVENYNMLRQIILLAKELSPTIRIVWDPILKSSSGFDFHSENALDLSFLEENCTLITPNWEEFVALWGDHPEALLQRHPDVSILIKGGHRSIKAGCDLLYTDGRLVEIEGESFLGKTKHGTGCVLSAAIAAHLANGRLLTVSCVEAKRYVERFILSNNTNLGYHYGH